MNRIKRAMLGVVFVAIVVSASAFVASIARAGNTYEYPVTVDYYWKQAYGALGSTRNTTTDQIQYLGCEANVGYADCIAQDANWNWVMCSTTDPAMVALVLGVSGDSAINFTYNANGQCTSLWVANFSEYPPKKH